ncbi:MAG: hypothetical protein AB7L13_16000 [Acidimicrobiia bacterium]
MTRPTPSSRETDLKRVTRTTRLTIAGGIVLSGALAGVAAQAYSGSSSASNEGDDVRATGAETLIPVTTAAPATRAPRTERPQTSTPTPTVPATSPPAATRAPAATQPPAATEAPAEEAAAPATNAPVAVAPPVVRPSNRRAGRSGGS